MTGPVHTPYQGGQKGFAIGLKPLDREHWIEFDAGSPTRLLEKEKLRADHPAETFLADPNSHEAQSEVRDLLWAHMPAYHPNTHQLHEGRMKIAGGQKTISITDNDGAPLRTAAELVEEDLCVMTPSGNGWMLSAASLCFPSHWSLREKFSHPMSKIHEPVPGFEGQMEQRVDRIMNNLRPDAPVWRMNWSLHDEPTLYQTGPSAHPRFGALTGPEIIKVGFIRIERQTLTKLPRTGAILFTIRTHLDPLGSLAPQNRDDLAAAIGAMTDAELNYRGIAHRVPEILDALTDAPRPELET